MAVTEFSAAINQLAAERGVTPEAVIEGVKQALAAAYRKDFGEKEEEEIEVQIDDKSGEVKIMKEEKDVTPPGFGRIAAQTAKQVILQTIREEERQSIRSEFEEKVGSIVSGYVFRVDKGVIYVDLGKTQGILPPSELIAGERYSSGQRIKALVKEVKEGYRGPEIILSRTDPRFVKELFALEVPEIAQGVVKIEAIAREAGRRTKMAVSSSEEKVDPVGSCVGQRGVRVQAVTRELGEEKVDIIPYSGDEEIFIASSLSPAKALDVKLKAKTHTAQVEVPEDQLSLAIGRDGQNVRLAAKLTGWRIDIKGAGAVFAEDTRGVELVGVGLSPRVVRTLTEVGIETTQALREKNEEELSAIKGLGPKSLAEIKNILGGLKEKGEGEEKVEEESSEG
ncbi:transcription termination/antitermination protein NusA [Candidatus Saccharibacteria bacterium]|nr:transcription termination/antitermination protein NusA [Candidatus Saccharibacteria bacterium]